MIFKSILSILFFFLTFSMVFSQKIDTIYSTDAFELLATDNPDLIIIDGRDSLMHSSGHIMGSVYLDAYSDDADELLMNYMGYQTLFIYCTTHRRTDTLIAKLIELGYTGRIICMRDGIRGWKENGYPIGYSGSE